MNEKILRTSLCLFAGILCLCSCSRLMTAYTINKYDIENKNFTDTIPIEFENNHPQEDIF